MTICLEHHQFDAVLADVRRAVADLVETRTRALSEVADLLEAWHGTAASSFQSGWADWSDAAADVASALDGLTDSMVVARSRLVVADDSSASAAARLAHRLG